MAPAGGFASSPAGKTGCVPRSPSRPLVAGLLLLATTVACSGSGEDDLPHATVGDVHPVELLDRVEGRHSYVVVPGRRYDFTVSRPTDRMDTVTAREAGVSDESGDDARFVGVTWELSDPLGDTFAMQVPPDVSPELSLVVDGTTTPVGALDREGVHGVYVAVPPDAEDIGLAVAYDGLVQSVADAFDLVSPRGDGPDLLYREPPDTDWLRCPEDELSGDEPELRFWGTECTVRLSSPLAYVGPLGWAPDGAAWVLAEVELPAPEASIDLGASPYAHADYEVDQTVRLTLDGQRPVESWAGRDREEPGEQDHGTWSSTVVFRVPTSAGDGRPLVLHRRYDAVLEAEDRSAGVPERIVRRQRVELG